MARCALAFAVLLTSGTGCSGILEPSAGSALHIVAGGSLTDSATAMPVQALVAELRDAAGRPRVGVPLEFRSAPPDTAHGLRASVFVSRLTQDQFRGDVTDTTDARGRAAVRLFLGWTAGTGAVIVTVPGTALVETVKVVVRPASARRIVLHPRDTALYVGASYRLGAASVDAYGNTREDPVGYVAQTAVAKVDQELLTALTIGRGSIRVQAAGLTDTAWVSVVPQGAIAANHVRLYVGDDAAIMFTNLDGSGFRTVTPTDGSCCDRTPAWTAAGTELIFEKGYPYEYLYRVDLTGSVRRFITDSLPIAQQTFAQPSRDGAWVYFSGQPDYQDWALWRVRADGTGAQQIGPAVTGYDVDWRPSPSPDGTQLAYVTNRTDSLTIRTLRVASGTVTPLDIAGEAVRWSPSDPNVLAYVHNGVIRLMRPDGTVLRQVSDSSRAYDVVFDWSPDGTWIVARALGRNVLELINTTSGLTLPLAFTTQLEQPAWRP
jgi:Tol biopolymer transport system component